jgi:hypothetical protein
MVMFNETIKSSCTNDVPWRIFLSLELSSRKTVSYINVEGRNGRKCTCEVS